MEPDLQQKQRTDFAEHGRQRGRAQSSTPRSLALMLFTALIVSWALLGFGTYLKWINIGFAVILAGLLSGFYLYIRRLHENEIMRVSRQTARNIRDQERERARAQAPLRSKIVQGFVDPLLMIDAERVILEANTAARAMFGPNLIGKDLFLIIRAPAALAAIKETMTSGQPAEREFSLDKAIGRQFTIRAAMVINDLAKAELKNENSNETPFYVVLAFNDVTKIKLTEKMRADFVANASHELRTPLTSLIGFIETLQGPALNDTPAQKRFLGIMATEAQRMVRVIDDLLSLSRIELDKYVNPTGTLKAKDLIEGVEHSLALALKDDNRAYHIDVQDDLPLVRGDQDQIIQVLQNLVSNAIKYGRSGTPILVKAFASNPQEVNIQVQDQGDGIAHEHIPRLTERFYRVDTARSRQMGGTGLGLAIVKHIIERHRGRLNIQSTPGTGTLISFTLPIATEKAQASIRSREIRS